MANKAPKKKESKEQISQSQGTPREANPSTTQILHDSASKRKPPIPLWVEWSDQDIANEKWDNGKVAKDRGRSPTATNSGYEDIEGKIDLPAAIRSKIHSWRRPCEIFNERVPTVVSVDHLNETHIDLLSPNEHITDSELIRHILSTFSSLYGIFASTAEPETVPSIIKMKASVSKDAKDSKVEKGKKDEYVEEMGWRPWHQIWPKEGTKGNNMPAYNPQGKYAVKIYWMGCYRKIIVDDTIPCDENLKPLLPVTCRGNEIWPIILTKALIKVASLDYYGGLSSSEFGDSNVIHCLTGWLPESIPIEPHNSEKIWNLLLELLPHWTLPSPRAPKCGDTACPIDALKKPEMIETEILSKQELLPKDSKGKKEEKGGKDDKKVKTNEKLDKDKGNKDKPVTPAVAQNFKKLEQPTPDFILYATFLNPPSSDPPCKFSEYKQMANISEKLRQFGLCQYVSHPVYLNTIRRCPLLPPPEPLKIPRWKLIRQKKNREIVEPKLNAEEPKEKDPKALQLKSMFFNFNLNHADMCSPLSNNDSIVRIPSISEEGQDDTTNSPKPPPDVPDVPTPEILIPELRELAIATPEIENPKKLTRSPSVASSQSSQTKKSGKSKENRKSAQKDRSEKKESSRHSIDIPPVSIEDPPENSDILSDVAGGGEMPDIPELDIEKDKEDEGKETDVWMDFEDFLQCFSMLWVYHKPKKHLKSIVDIKSFDQKSDKPRKSAGNTLSDVKNVLGPPSFMGGIATDSLPPFLLFDCVEQAEVVIHFSSLSRWIDPNLDLSIRNQGKEQEAMMKQVLTPAPGTLMVEPFFWKQIVTPSPLIRLSTTGVRCVVLTLPPGRHVLRFMINTPLGYHIGISSPQSFIFDDEHVIIQHLTKVSERYTAHAVDLLKQLKTISQGFHDKTIPRSVAFTIGTEDQCESVRKEHYETFFSCLASILKSEMGENFNGKMQFAINALKFEAYFHMEKPKHTHVDAPASVLPVEESATDDIPKEAGSADADMAAVKLQSTFKGFYTRLLMRAYNYIDSKENKMTVEMLEKIWACVDANIETIASNVYLKLFGEKPALHQLFPFYEDQSNKVSYNDYNGKYPEPVNTSWFLIFRELFYVLEPNLILPKLYTTLQNYQLKVIDNDTKEELKTLFSKVVPQTLAKNKSGYTFVATASHHSSVPSGNFRLRIIGGNDNLPICAKEGVVSTQFATKEIKDHYIPNRYNRILRHTVKVTEDVLTSIQFLTSKDDVMVKLQVLDDNEVIYTCEGKKTVTVPALIFKKDRAPSSEDVKNSRASSQTGSIISVAKSAKQASRRNSSPEKTKRTLFKMVEMKSEDISEEETHNYIVECFVLRDSWPLTRKEWIFVENQKNSDTIEKEMSTDSVSKADPANRANSAKNRKNTRQESRAKKDRPPSQNQNQFDTSKAHWTLQFIVDAHLDAAIEIKRDSQREEEIKAIKSAWETVEPGRAAKAVASRQKYLESHTVSGPIDEESGEKVEEDQGDKMEEDASPPEPVTSESPVPSEPDTGELFSEPPMKENLPVIQSFDVTPYIRSSGKKTILDEIEEERRQAILQDKFANFHEQRERVLQMRENSRISRNLEKEKQILEYEKMQIQLDEARAELYRARDAYRNKFIPQSATDAEADADKKKNKSPSPKAKASKKGKKK